MEKLGKRKRGRSVISETLIRKAGGEKGGFLACYLLASLNPSFKNQTYIGFTVNPRRRIRQHNGEIRCGASRTKSRRPWEMVLCVYGFPTNVAALQFEWAWQHPRKSLAVKNAAAAFKSFTGIANKIKLVYTMLTLPPWQSLNLGVNFFSTKYTNLSAGCPNLPKHMKVQVCSIEELLCNTKVDCNVHEDEESDRIGKDYTSTDEISEVATVHNSEDQIKDCEDYNQGTESSSLVTSNKNKEESLEDRGVFGLDEECTVLEQLQTSTGNGKCETEEIDVFIHSPSYRYYSRRKKRKVSAVCKEIIDLTESPIFV